MKTLLFRVLALSLAFFSVNALADKIVVTGEPIVVEKQGEYYVVPSTATMSTGGYYYVNVNNTKRVCYKEVQPALAKIDSGIFRFRVGSDTVSVHCYDYSPDYFVVP